MTKRTFPYKDQEKELEFQKFKSDYHNGKVELVDMSNDKKLKRMQQEAIDNHEG
jgi:hypothetical protein